MSFLALLAWFPGEGANGSRKVSFLLEDSVGTETTTKKVNVRNYHAHEDLAPSRGLKEVPMAGNDDKTEMSLEMRKRNLEDGEAPPGNKRIRSEESESRSGGQKGQVPSQDDAGKNQNRDLPLSFVAGI